MVKQLTQTSNKLVFIYSLVWTLALSLFITGIFSKSERMTAMYASAGAALLIASFIVAIDWKKSFDGLRAEVSDSMHGFLQISLIALFFALHAIAGYMTVCAFNVADGITFTNIAIFSVAVIVSFKTHKYTVKRDWKIY